MGHAPPYVAVISLCAVTATHWRLLRAKYHSYGIADPMAALPSLHALLDDTEQLVLESLTAADPKRAEQERDQFFDKLYAPDSTEAKELNGERYEAVPAGFEDRKQVEAEFNAFAQMMGGGSRRRAR